MALQKIPGRAIQLDSQANSSVMYYDGTDWVHLAKGTAGQILTVDANALAPEWGEIPIFQGRSYGYTVGGEKVGTVPVNIIDKFSFSSNGNATDVGDLTVTRSFTAGQQY